MLRPLGGDSMGAITSSNLVLLGRLTGATPSVPAVDYKNPATTFEYLPVCTQKSYILIK